MYILYEQVITLWSLKDKQVKQGVVCKQSVGDTLSKTFTFGIYSVDAVNRRTSSRRRGGGEEMDRLRIGKKFNLR